MQPVNAGRWPYRAQIVGFEHPPEGGTISTINFQVFDDSHDDHGIMAIPVDVVNTPPDFMSAVREALQRLYISECGSAAAALAKAMDDGVQFR